MRKMLFLLLAIATSATAWSQAQPDYIPEQLGRDAHHIIQSLGAFVGNERAESQSFDITYMPAGNGVEGVMIINTADYRCTFKLDAEYEMCYELTIDIRSKEFLDQFYNLFAVYRPRRATAASNSQSTNSSNITCIHFSTKIFKSLYINTIHEFPIICLLQLCKKRKKAFIFS